MRYVRAVEKLRTLAEGCQRTTRMPMEEPFLHEAYVFGEVLDGADTVERVKVVFALNLPMQDMPWGSQPPGTPWLVDVLRLDKGGIAYWWRSIHEPIANHVIRDPVRFWSLDGVDEVVFDALRERRFADLPRQTANAVGTADELDRALEHLRAVRDRYWDREWRREHRGNGRYPENALWEAADGYLDLLAAMDVDPPGKDQGVR